MVFMSFVTIIKTVSNRLIHCCFIINQCTVSLSFSEIVHWQAIYLTMLIYYELAAFFNTVINM